MLQGPVATAQQASLPCRVQCNQHSHANTGGAGAAGTAHKPQWDRRLPSTLASNSSDLRRSCKGFASVQILHGPGASFVRWSLTF